MNCIEVEPLLSELLDGELPDAARAGVEEHVAGCGGCAEEYRALRRTVRFVRARSRVEMAPGTPGGIYEEFNRAIADPASDADPIAVMVEGLLREPRAESKGDES